MNLLIPIKPAKSLDELRRDSGNGARKIGLVYYQKLNEKGWIVRTITEKSDAQFLKRLLLEGNLYLPEEELISEMG
jgi:hypothetical protein